MSAQVIELSILINWLRRFALSIMFGLVANMTIVIQILENLTLIYEEFAAGIGTSLESFIIFLAC